MAGLIEVAPRARDPLPAPMLSLFPFDEFEYFPFIATCHGRSPLTKPDFSSSVANAAENGGEPCRRSFRPCDADTPIVPYPSHSDNAFTEPLSCLRKFSVRTQEWAKRTAAQSSRRRRMMRCAYACSCPASIISFAASRSGTRPVKSSLGCCSASRRKPCSDACCRMRTRY